MASNNDYEINRIVSQMQYNSYSWNNADEETRADMQEENESLAEKLRTEYGIIVTKKNGSWYLPDGTRLYDKYGRVNVQTGQSQATTDRINYQVTIMKSNSQKYLNLSNDLKSAGTDEEKDKIQSEMDELVTANEEIVDNELSTLGVTATKTDGGVWLLKDGTRLYDKYGNISTYGDSSKVSMHGASFSNTVSGAVGIGASGRASWNGSLYSGTKSVSGWGKLPGYAWDTAQQDAMNMDPDWRKSTEWARTWMGDGVPSTDAETRRLIPWQKFDRFYSVDTERENPSGRHYIFILRPDLYLIEPGTATDPVIQLCQESNVAQDPYFTYLARTHPEIVASLTGDFAGLGGATLTTEAATASGIGNAMTSDGTTINGVSLAIHTFIPYLTSRIESLQLPDYTIDTNILVQPYTKYSIPYSLSAIKSTTGGNFDIVFREDRYYSLHKLFYAWLYYQNNVARNVFKPKKKYLQYNTIDYATSIYDFLVDETGEDVIYWSKYTGCIPTGCPMSDLGYNRDGAGEKNISIPFQYFYCEHLDLNTIRDFQYNSLGYTFMKTCQNQFTPCSFSDTEPIYNAIDHYGAAFTGRPVIMFVTLPDGQRRIKLRWLKDPTMTKANRISA